MSGAAIDSDAARIDGAPPEWETVTLEALTDPVRVICYGILMPKEHVHDGVPYVKVKDIRDGVIDVAGLRRTTPEIAAKYERASLKGGDVLVSIRGTYGRVATVPPELVGANITQDTARLALLPGVDREFLALFLHSPFARNYFARVARGVAVKGVNIGDLRAMPVPLPSLDEQHRIVAAVARKQAPIRRGRADVERSFALLRQYKEACRAAAFDEAWPVSPLDEVADVQSGLAKGRRDPGAEPVPYLSTANVQAGYLNLAVVKMIEATPAQQRRHRLEPGDVLVLEGGDADKVGRGWIWQGEIENCLHQNHVFAVRSNREVLFARFLAHFVNAPPARRYFASCAKQTVNLASINKTQLRALPVPLPSLDHQERAVRLLESQLGEVADLELALKTALAQAETLERSLLQRAFSGDLVRRDTSPGAAAALRIKLERERARLADGARQAKTKPAVATTR